MSRKNEPGPSWRPTPSPTPSPPPPTTSSPPPQRFLHWELDEDERWAGEEEWENEGEEPKAKRQRHVPQPDSDTSDDEHEEDNLFTVNQGRVRQFKYGPVTDYPFQLTINEAEFNRQFPAERVQEGLYQILSRAFRNILRHAGHGTVAQVYVESPALSHTIPTPRRRPQDLSFEDLASQITNYLESNKYLTLSNMTITLSTIRLEEDMVVGTVATRFDNNIAAFVKSSRCLDNPMTASKRPVPGFEHMCFPLVLFKELEILRNGWTRTKARMFATTRACARGAAHLTTQAGLHPTQAPFSLEQLPRFASALPDDVTVSIFDSQAPPLMKFGAQHGPRFIDVFLMYGEEQEDGTSTAFHAVSITSLAAFFKCERVCRYCYKGYYARLRHNCSLAVCNLCKTGGCVNQDNERKSRVPNQCLACGLFFYTLECLLSHRPTCEDYRKCLKCGCVMAAAAYAKHPCGQPWCSTCMANHSPFQHCVVGKPRRSLQAWKREQSNRPMSVWYCDAESSVDNNTQQHTANLLVAERQLDEHTPLQRKEYYGQSTMLQFVNEAMQPNSAYMNSVCVFHNGSGYDLHLVYKALMVDANETPAEMITKGQRIISLRLPRNKVEFRDSLQFLPGTKLAAFPKMFELPCPPKGYFPHGINTERWIRLQDPTQQGSSDQDYSGFQHIAYREEQVSEDNSTTTVHRFPPLKYFWTSQLSPEEKRNLEQWHETECQRYASDTSLVYIPALELVNYCRNDVQLLRCGFEKCRREWLQMYPEIEPLDCYTFPQYNNRIFRTYYLKENYLAMLPPQGYGHGNRKYSVSAMAWVTWKAKELGLERSTFRCARKGGEVKVSGLYVDATGVDANNVRHVFNYHGCYWHGHQCPRIRQRNDVLDIRLENTQRKDNHLFNLSTDPESPYGPFVYHRIWGCEFQQQQDEDPEFGAWVTAYKREFPRQQLKPRSSLRGGRVEAYQHCVWDVNSVPGQRLQYVDFTSLYPSVQYSTNGEEWPISTPDIYIGTEVADDAPPVDQWFGLVNLTLLPPRQLRIPPLGTVVNGKLTFHLCSACAASQHQGMCEHRDDERVIQGVYFTKEVQLALEKGYQFWGPVQELWHWPEERRTTNIFCDMIRDQYAKKALSSPIPTDRAEFLRLIQSYHDTMGLDLREEEFQENKAIRCFSKFSVNNIWGFLGKHNDYQQIVFLNSYGDLLERLNDTGSHVDRIEVTENEELVLLTYRPAYEPPSRSGNIVLASLTTAFARLRLYSLLQQYEREAVYADTDSVYLLLGPGQQGPQLSSVLGGLKDEIFDAFGEGAYISSFSSLGAKCYTYKVERDGQLLTQITKMKGIKFSHEAQQSIYPEKIDQLARQHDNSTKVDVRQTTITRDFFKYKLCTAKLKKQIQFISDKRWVDPNDGNDTLNSYPYGYSVQ